MATSRTHQKGTLPFDEPRREKFLASLRKWANVSEACKAARVQRSTAYDHRAKDVEFAAAWDLAIEEGVESLEREAWRRAREGTKRERGVYYRGSLVEVVRETHYSDTLLIFLLKARKAMYRETVNQNINMRGSLRAGLAELSDPDIDAEIAALVDASGARAAGDAAVGEEEA